MRPARHVITTSPSKSAVAAYGVGAGSVNIRWRSVSTGMWFAAAGRGTASARTTTPKITHRIARALYIGDPPSRKYPTDCDLRQPGLHLQNNAYRGGRLPARVRRPGRSRRGSRFSGTGPLPQPATMGCGDRELAPRGVVDGRPGGEQDTPPGHPVRGRGGGAARRGHVGPLRRPLCPDAGVVELWRGPLLADRSAARLPA